MTSVLVLLVGACIGSFLNVVIHRLPKMLERDWHAQAAELRGETSPNALRYNLASPRSACPACGHRLSAWENLPIISWLLLRGRCSVCKTGISVRYLAVEIAAALLGAYSIWRFGLTIKGAAACGFLWALIALTFIDLDTQLLPDNLTLPLLWAGLLANLLGAVPSVSLRDAVIGAMAGYLVLWAVYWLFRLVRGKEAMGYGDFKLFAALGAWLGWQMLLLIALLSSSLGAIVGIGLTVLNGRDRSIPIPFGPYLAIAGALALFFGPPLLTLLHLPT